MTPQIRKRLEAVAICALIAVSIASMVWWNAKTSPVLAGRPHPVLAHVLDSHQYPDAFDPLWHIPKQPPQFRLAHYFMDLFGRSYEIIISIQFLFFLALVFASWRIGSRLGGPAAGRLTALFAAFTPVHMTGALVFDDHMLNMALVAAGVACLVEGRGWRRIIFAVPAGLCFGLTLRYSFIFSNGLIAAACGVFALFGMTLEGLLYRGNDESDAYESKVLWPGSMITLAACAILVLATLLLSLNRDGGLLNTPVNYYLSEVSAGAASPVWVDPVGLLTYPYLIFRHQLGPFLSMAVLVGLFGLLRNKIPGRFSLILWFFGPLIILTIISKKNYYYDYCALVAASPLAGVGIASFSKRQGWSRAAGLSVCVIAAYSLLRLFTYSPAPMTPMMRYLQSRPRIFLQEPYQSSFIRLDDIVTVSSLIEDVAEARIPVWIVMTGQVALDVLEEWRYGILMRNPRYRFDVVKDDSCYAPISANTFFLQSKDPSLGGKPVGNVKLDELLMGKGETSPSESALRMGKIQVDLKHDLQIVYESKYWILFRAVSRRIGSLP
jgi:4-amino-4-deoxy-L-arabinose transferase-like glycosyltransferase